MIGAEPAPAEEGGSPLSTEKQFELMFLDVVSVITDRKRTLFELSKWLVTLQGLIVGFAAVKGLAIGPEFLSAPLLIGLVGLLLNVSLSTELAEHRKSLALIREKVGGEFAALHKGFIDHHLGREGVKRRKNYWGNIAVSHKLIILVSTFVATYCVYSIV